MFEIGNSLREARLRQQLDFPEIEHATKIRGKYLRALEEEQFDVLPAQTYVKGFLRTYAEQLGLDGQLYVDEYNSRYVAGDEESPLRAGRPQPQPRERRVQRGVVLAVLGGIAVLTALVIAAWKFGGSSGHKALAPPPTKHHKAPAHTKHKTLPSSVTLDVRATHGFGSYLEVHVGSRSGKQLYQGTLQQGQKQVFRAHQLWFTLGAPGNVVVRANGVRRDLPGHGYPRVLVLAPAGLRLASVTG